LLNYKSLITVVKPPSLKGNERLLEKIKADYKDDFNQAFDVGRFTILCDNEIKLQTAVTIMKKKKIHFIVSKDKDFFDRQSKTHHRFHNIKFYLFYELVRAWKSKDSSKEEKLKYASDETLTKINDKKVMLVQGKSRLGKSIFCHYLEEALWINYTSYSKKAIPVYISFAKFYNK
ncbi:hypothetical protein RFI_22606, partial [Reticulomyxa filosa]